MLNIFVLEDDFFQQSRLENAIRRCVEETSVRYKFLEVFGKSNQLLESIEEAGNHQFFFLDIEIKGEEKKGMEIAKEIRARDPYAVIVFVTTHSEFMPVTYRYRVSALDFIDKGLEDSDFQKAVSDVLVHAFENIDHTVAENSFVYKTETAHIQVPFSDILYFETSSTIHKVILKTKTGQTEFYGKVSDLAKADERLYQAHRSCVVNPLNISVLITAVLFAFVHSYEISLSFWSALFPGFLFSWIYYKTNHLKYPIVAHILSNSIVTILNVISV